MNVLLGKYIVKVNLQYSYSFLLCRESASCTHISGLLHALVSTSHAPFDPVHISQTDDEDTPLPITSFACQWKAPRKRKEADAKISDVTFEKHVYGRTKKHNTLPIHDFDPRPQETRGTLSSRLPKFLEKVKGQGLGISMIADASTQVWSHQTANLTTSSDLPSKQALQERVSVFVQSLHMSAEKIRAIERDTKDQHLSTQWYSVRRYRLTASKFGEVLHRRSGTPPDALVLRIIEPKQFSTTATEWGKRQESVALEQYERHQRSLGHLQITVCKAGFVICEEQPFLGATPDAYVHDPSISEPYGVIEIKCPYKYRDMSPEDACLQPDFCATLESQADGTKNVRLKHSHHYFAQIQGQMAITGRHWCHFVLYTKNGLSVETIPFDENFWKTELLPALEAFYMNCVAPEIVCPVHLVGLPVRDLRQCH